MGLDNDEDEHDGSTYYMPTWRSMKAGKSTPFCFIELLKKTQRRHRAYCNTYLCIQSVASTVQRLIVVHMTYGILPCRDVVRGRKQD
jgi:hypothetical protein